MNRFVIYGYSMTIVLLLSGCHGLKTINEYAGAATTSLSTFDAAKVSFADNYRNSIKRDSVEKHDYAKTPVLARDLEALFSSGTAVKQFEKADSASSQVITVLREYFNGLEQLSNNKLITFDPKFESLGTVLKNPETLNLSADQTQAYQKLINFIGRAALDGYRRKKLSTYINDAYEPVKTTLTTLQTITGIMRSEVDGQRSSAWTGYAFQVNQADALYLTRLNLARDYTREYDKLSDRMGQLTNFSRTLAVLQKSHDEVYTKRDSWDKKELRAAIMANLTELRKLKADFDKLAK